MKHLLVRLERLEARLRSTSVPPLRCGYLTRLPDDYIGDRHVVIASRTTQSDGTEWCEFEERPGPGPVREEDCAFTVPALEIYLTRDSDALEDSERSAEVSGETEDNPAPKRSVPFLGSKRKAR